MMVMSMYRTYTGRIDGSDMKCAILAAEALKPGVKNIYVRPGADEITLEFVIRKREGEKVEEIVVRTSSNMDSSFVRNNNSLDILINGYAICISIPLYRKASDNLLDCHAILHTGGFGPSVGCSLPGKE